jgi:hypothetical protein
MSASQKRSVTQLAAERQRLYDDFGSRQVDNERIDVPQFKKIVAIETKLVRATFKTKADNASGRRILAGGDSPAPVDWCYFKLNLHPRMQEFA